MIENGMPSTGDLATTLRTCHESGAWGLVRLSKLTGLPKEDVSDQMSKLGTDMIQFAKGWLEERGHEEKTGAPLLALALIGLGWSGIANSLGLSHDYIEMLTGLNDMDVTPYMDGKK